MMSRYPRVVIMPVRAPLYSSTALVAMVVPWKTCGTSVGAIPWRSHSSRMPTSTPAEGSAGVVGTLWITVTSRSVSDSTRSVKVPPTSTPMSFMSAYLLLPLRASILAFRALDFHLDDESAHCGEGEDGNLDRAYPRVRERRPSGPRAWRIAGMAPPSVARARRA